MEPEGAELRNVLAQVAERIAQYRSTNIGEQNTKLGLINPVLRALGWNVEDLEDVRHEYRRLSADKPVDYALLLARTPRLFVEAKGLDENLQDARWSDQILGYAMRAGVEWVVLTNGDEYRIYNAHAPVPVEQKLFRSIRVSEDSAKAAEALALLSKDQTRENSLTALWTTYSVDRRVKEATERMFAPEPSPWLVRRLTSELDGLTAGDVKAGLGRARITLDFPAREQLPSRDGVLTARADREPRANRRTRTTSSSENPNAEAVQSVTVKDLIEGGWIEPPLDLRRTYKGRDLSARIDADGHVSCLGETYKSVSVAAAMARLSVIGPSPGRKYPQTNGWTFWRFQDVDGQQHELSVLRERFAAWQRVGAQTPESGSL